MNTIHLIPAAVPTLYPVTKSVGDIRIAGQSIGQWITERLSHAVDVRTITIRADFFISPSLALQLLVANKNTVIKNEHGELARVEIPGIEDTVELPPDPNSVIIRYPWDLLAITETLVGALTEDDIQGTVRERVSIDGHIRLGKGSVILPGVFIEGNAVFGDNCKIGPNCYIRGQTAIGNNCHIGQAVEVKNSLLFDNVAVGHLSYVGDSVICDRVNFGAGTIVSNLRHDGKNHKFKIDGQLIDTGRRKLGAIIGEDVHTGIHSAIYPGRFIAPGDSTRPAQVIEK